MSKAFSQIGTFTPDNLIAGNQVPLLTKAFELAVGTGTLKRGSVISITGELAGAETTEVDGILTDDVELNASAKTNATIYISGEFNSTFMTTDADTTPLSFERELRTLGIFIK
jgi:hypothetical protein